MGTDHVHPLVLGAKLARSPFFLGDSFYYGDTRWAQACLNPHHLQSGELQLEGWGFHVLTNGSTRPFVDSHTGDFEGGPNFVGVSKL